MKVRKLIELFKFPKGVKIKIFFDKENLDDFNNQWNNSRDASKNTKFQQDKKENFNAVIPETKKLDSSDNESFISKIFSWFK